MLTLSGVNLAVKLAPGAEEALDGYRRLGMPRHAALTEAALAGC